MVKPHVGKCDNECFLIKAKLKQSLLANTFNLLIFITYILVKRDDDDISANLIRLAEVWRYYAAAKFGK